MDFVERHFNVIALFALLLVLMSAHSFMVHAGRPTQMIEWVENLITGVFGGIMGILASKKE